MEEIFEELRERLRELSKRSTELADKISTIRNYKDQSVNNALDDNITYTEIIYENEKYIYSTKELLALESEYTKNSLDIAECLSKLKAYLKDNIDTSTSDIKSFCCRPQPTLDLRKELERLKDKSDER